MNRRSPLINTSHPVALFIRRALLLVFGAPILIAIAVTLIDSYRSRGKKPKPFNTLPAKRTEIGEGAVTTYTFGQDLYDDMIAAIESAEQEVLLETYIWKGDEVGEQFKDALIRAAARGVTVRVIYDKFANLVVSPQFKRFPPSISVLAYPLYNAGWRFYDLRRYGRDHRKVLVVDDRTAFVGGYNIGSSYAREWRDTHCRVEGAGAWELKRSFIEFWNQHHRRKWRRRARPITLPPAPAWSSQVRVHRNLPNQWTFPIRSMYLDAINRAQRNVWLTHAYFIPDENFVESLTEASERGVDVRILLPAKSNHIVADLVSRGYFGRMLNAGIHIYRFRDAMVHAKTATIDGNWSTIGTANVDRLSMTGNYEINVEIIDPALAQNMEEIFTNDLLNTWPLSAAEWESRDIYRRFTEIVFKPLRPML